MVALPLTTLHVIVLLVAVDGATVPVRVRGVPTVATLETPVMSVTGTNAALLTVMVKSLV
jgi:hypothetical protein